MKLRKELMLLSVISIVFLAGCTSGGESPTGTGVIIKSFAPDVQTVDGGSQVTFTIGAQNIGGKTANNVKALIFGLSNEWKTSSGGDWTPALITFGGGTLAQADPSTGLKGEEGTADLTLSSPLGKGGDTTYDASVRVFYDYQTISDSLLRFVTSSYLKTNPNVQKGVVSSSSTSGPLIITTVARTPTIQSGQGKVQFEIQNVGGGRVFSGLSGNDPTNLDTIATITVKGVDSCAGTPKSGDVVTLTSQRLAGGKSKIISCNVVATGATNFQDVAVTVTLSYNYFVDSATTVTVLKTLGEADFTLGLNPSSGSMVKPSGDTVVSPKPKLTVTPFEGFTGAVTITYPTTVTGVSTASTGTISSPYTPVDISITVSSTAVAGTYPMIIRGTSGSLIREATYTLTIT